MDPKKRTKTATEKVANEAAQPATAPVAVLDPVDPDDFDDDDDNIDDLDDDDLDDDDLDDDDLDDLDDDDLDDDDEDIENEPPAPEDLGDLVDDLENPEAPIFNKNSNGDPQDERARVIALAEALRTQPYHLEVRLIPPAGTPGRGRNLRPLKGHLTAQDLAPAATLEDALRPNHDPGDYWLVLRDLRSRKAVADFAVRLNAAAAAAGPAVAQIEAQTREAAARKQLRRAQRELAEEEAELAAVRRGRRDDRPLEELDKRLAQLERSRSEPPAWLAALLPVLAPALGAALKRLFAPAPSIGDSLKDLVPLVQTMAEGALSARNETAAAEQRRADAAFGAYLDLLKQRAGVEDEPEDSPVALLQQVLAMVRPPASPPPAPVAAAAAPPQRAPRKLTPLGSFAVRLVRAHRDGWDASDAAGELIAAWDRVPPEQQLALVEQDQQALAALLPQHLPREIVIALTKIAQSDDGPQWITDVLGLLAPHDDDSEPDESTGPIVDADDLELTDSGFSG